MKDRDVMDDPNFDAAWRALAEDDARTLAPERVKVAVLAAWDASLAAPTVSASGWTRTVFRAAALAVAAVLLIVRFAVHPGQPAVRDLAPPATAPLPGIPSTLVSNAASPDIDARVVPPSIRRDDIAATVTDRSPTDIAMPIVRLAADPLFDGELLQIVRVRVPRGTLQAFGVPLIEPDASALVDIDVLVGDDGLARDIRRIRPVVDTGAR